METSSWGGKGVTISVQELSDFVETFSASPCAVLFTQELKRNKELIRKKHFIMQQQDGAGAPAPQPLALPSQDAKRLLEVYVKRSLSFDGAAVNKKPRVKLWRSGTLVERRSRIRKQESNACVQPASSEVVGDFSRIVPTPVPDSSVKPGVTSKKSEKKSKKPSFLKSILGLLSRKTSEKNEEEEATPVKTGASAATQQNPLTTSCLPFLGGSLGASPHPSRQLQRKVSSKISFRTRGSEEAKFTPVKRPSTLAVFDQGHKPEIVSVEPNNTYYEKVSEELAKIVRRVKDEGHLTSEHSTKAWRNTPVNEKEVMDRITELLKEEGDAIDIKLKGNSYINSFFQGLSYGSFQQLADRYLEAETPEPLPPNAGCKELVHFAVTLDFTAKMAGLSNQAVGSIMGFGRQYLQDRFLQMNFAHSGAPAQTQVQTVASVGQEPGECQEQERHFFSLD
ncbi:apoptosis facilitator Bcl-2-like protein 14 [Arapaima gigas]